MIERAEQAANSFIAWAVAGVLGGALWLVRRIFTNQRQVEMMMAEIALREAQRKEERKADRELLNDTRADVKEIRDDIKTLFQRHGK